MFKRVVVSTIVFITLAFGVSQAVMGQHPCVAEADRVAERGTGAWMDAFERCYCRVEYCL
ncbi:hypothetical protein APED_16785 [Acanthopleuribacter pedis]